MAISKWNLETIRDFINSKYDNVELINVYSKRRKSGIFRKFITISNGERVRDMELNNFLKRGCDFYEKTDKKVDKLEIENYLKEKHSNLNLRVLDVKHESNINGGRMIKVYMQYKNYKFMSHWQTLRDYEHIPTLRKYLEYENTANEKYNCEIVNMENRRITLQKDGIVKNIAMKTFSTGEFIFEDVKDIKDIEIMEYMKGNKPEVEVLKIYRKQIRCKIDIYLECKYKDTIYNVSIGSIKKGFSFGEKIPLGEKIMIEVLIEKGIEYETQKQFEGMKYKGNLKFDFYLPMYNVALEVMGIQHFEPVKRFGGDKKFEETVIRDNIKREYCKNNNIKLIEIDRSKEMTSKRNIAFKNKCLTIIEELIGK